MYTYVSWTFKFVDCNQPCLNPRDFCQQQPSPQYNWPTTHFHQHPPLHRQPIPAHHPETWQHLSHHHNTASRRITHHYPALTFPTHRCSSRTSTGCHIPLSSCPHPQPLQPHISTAQSTPAGAPSQPPPTGCAATPLATPTLPPTAPHALTFPHSSSTS